MYNQNVGTHSEQKKQSKLAYFIILAGSISFLIAFPTIVLLLVGMGLDAWLNKSPMFTIGGAITGFLSSFINIYRLLKRISN